MEFDSTSLRQINGIRIAGTGAYLPGEPFSQAQTRELLRRHNDPLPVAQQEHLLRESGIQFRHFAIDSNTSKLSETNSSMAAAAGARAITAAGWTADEVDLLVVTTVVPDQLMPPTSTLVQEALGMQSCTELEISANCTAPTKGLMVAASQIQIGAARRALVCSAQLASFASFPPFADPARMQPNQAHLRWILSDGAGAIALEAGDPDIGLRVHLESRGVGKRSGMHMDIGAAFPDVRRAFTTGRQHVTQDPLYAMKNAMRLADEGLRNMLHRLELPGSAIDHFLPSISSTQVARRMSRVFERSGIRPEVWRTNFTHVGYVGSVAVPIMLNELIGAGRIRSGDIVCTIAEESSKWMFAGCVFRWNP